MKLHQTADGKVVVSTPAKELPKVHYDGQRRLDNWIQAFLDYTDILDVPINFLRWAAISTIAGAAQRKLYMDMGHFELMSNLYVVLVGPPGTKKSTAIRTGMRLLQKVPGINLAPDAPSIPGLMSEFDEIKQHQKDHQSLNAFVLELSSLYENAKESMTEFLTKMYDCDADYIKRTRIGGKEQIPFPWLNLVAGTTPGWIGRNIGMSELEEGLEARKINVFSSERKISSARPKLTARHKKLREDLIHDLARISSLYGAFDFEGGEEGIAYQWYDHWYQDHFIQAAAIEAELGFRDLEKVPAISRFPKIVDFRTDGYYNRKHVHLIKVAMVVSLSRKDELFITLEDLLTAQALLQVIEADMPKVYSSVGGNVYMTEIERIHQSIQQAGKPGLLYSEIVSVHLHAMERVKIDDALKSLEIMGDISCTLDVSQKPPEKRYFPM